MDIRIIKTKKAIKDAFYTLLEKKPIEKITVTELTNLAQIGRMTFYLHYADIYALNEDIENEILDGISRIFTRQADEGVKISLQRRISQTLDYVCSNQKEFYMGFFNRNSAEKLVANSAKLFLEEFYPEKKTYYGNVEVNFVAHGIVGVISEWVKSGSENREEFEKTLLHIVSRFIS